MCFSDRLTRELLLHADRCAKVPIPICSIVFLRWKRSSETAIVIMEVGKVNAALLIRTRNCAINCCGRWSS